MALVDVHTHDDYVEQAKEIFREWYLHNEHDTSHSDPEGISTDEVYVVWFVKVLQHWKALISTTRPDGMYYELTYNGDREETYVDEYSKVSNTAVPDTTGPVKSVPVYECRECGHEWSEHPGACNCGNRTFVIFAKARP